MSIQSHSDKEAKLVLPLLKKKIDNYDELDRIK